MTATDDAPEHNEDLDMWGCPDCGTLVSSETKAVDHCADGTSTNDDRETDDDRDENEPLRVREALTAAIEYFHRQIDRPIRDHCGTCTHPECGSDEDECERPSTARDYFREVRGWSDETIDEFQLGWAPRDGREVYDQLLAKRFTRKELLSTGLFPVFDDGSVGGANFAGRYVLPYFDADDQVAYAIARTTGSKGGGKAGYDGHPSDHISGKYAKLSHTKDYARVSEPMWGLGTVRDGEPLVVAEGIADAITVAAAGYPVVSPVAKEFKREHHDKLLDTIRQHDISRVFVIPDAERAGFSRIDSDDVPAEPDRIRETINIPKAAPGPAGGMRTVAFLDENDVDARYVDLPLLSRSEGHFKVDLDDYLHEWSEDLEAVLRSARRVSAPALGGLLDRSGFVPGEAGGSDTNDEGDDNSYDDEESDGQEYQGEGKSALFDLCITDVTPSTFSKAGDRGKNPLHHYGTSENYFEIRERKENDELYAKDYKHADSPSYNALTYLLVDAEERSVDDPGGELSDREVWVAYRQASKEELVADDDPIPTRALRHLAIDGGLCEPTDLGGEDNWRLPTEAYNGALEVARDAGVEPGRSSLRSEDDDTDDSDDWQSQQYDVETCEPPERLYETATPDVDAMREEMAGPAYDDFVERGGVHIRNYVAGGGKTATHQLAADDRDRPFAAAFDKHAKAWESRDDDVTPDADLQMRSGSQPRHECCLAVKSKLAIGRGDEVETIRDDEGRKIPVCPEHGPETEWEHMCPAYDLPPGDEDRKRFDAIVEAFDVRTAHHKMGLNDPETAPDWHPVEDAAWCQQFDDANHAHHVTGVHEYQLLKSFKEGEACGERDLIVDEAPRTLDRTIDVDPKGLTLAANLLEEYGDLASRYAGDDEDEQATGENLRALASFARDIREYVTEVDGQASVDLDRIADRSVTEIEPPEIVPIIETERTDAPTARAARPFGSTTKTETETETHRWTVDSRDDVPEDVPDECVERRTRQHVIDGDYTDPENVSYPEGYGPDDAERRTIQVEQGMGGYYRKETRWVVDESYYFIEVERQITRVERYDEALAQAKLRYNERALADLVEDDERYNGAPFCVDALLTTLAECYRARDRDDRTEAALRAVASPKRLTGCPWCGSKLAHDNGARVCTADGCIWHEVHQPLVQGTKTPARAIAYVEADPRRLGDDDDPGLFARVLAHPDDLPEDLFVLDATATPERIAGLYGRPVEHVESRMWGNEPLDLSDQVRTTQVVGGRHRDDGQYHIGGQYHAGTIKNSAEKHRADEPGGGAYERIQATIEKVCAMHDRPLFGIKRDLESLFEWPDNAVVLHYGAARGLDRQECDAVCCIGAPHPDMVEIEREARLLAMHHPDLDVGGEEFSTRREDGELAANPPKYRKLLYEDENGEGLSVPTKTFSGLVGKLFEEAREKELVQFIHRIRPVLVDADSEPMKHAYLLTDVPLDIQIDHAVGFEELAADDLRVLFPVSDGALDMLRTARDVAEGNGPDGFRPGELVEQRDDGTLANKAKGYHEMLRRTGEDVSLTTVYNRLDELEAVGLLVPEEYEQRRGVTYAADLSTFKRALQVLSSNAGLKVDALTALKAKLRESANGLDWLEWAETVFDVYGDRCEWGPPPDPT